MTTKNKFIFIYITFATQQQTKEIAKTILNEKLIACANFFPIQSIYWWENKLQENSEWALIIKTATKNSLAIQQKVEKIHPYSTPCITIIPVKPNEKYATWLTQQLN